MYFRHIIKSLSVAAFITTYPFAAISDDQSVRPEKLEAYKTRPITADIMYFVMPDRFENGDTSNDKGGIEGGVMQHGFDPTHKGFYHGGDLKGLTSKLDYLADMGISAVWMTPIFKNKAVQPNSVNITSGYHGYWVTDFTQIDPHLGTNDDLKELVEEAHKRNMKVVFDIITNHTADVIKYRECLPEEKLATAKTVPLCEYKKKGTKKLTPYIPVAEKNIKVPAWLNDPSNYNNQGDSMWKGESSIYGDFAGLDDIDTDQADVIAGMIDIFKFWISEFKIDGYRIDTVRHVTTKFWQSFAPAILDHAHSEGVENFYMFGEVYDPDPVRLSYFTTEAKLPTVLDFGYQSASQKVIAEDKAPNEFSKLFAQDHLYSSDNGDASILPTFLGNHDMGRIGHIIKKHGTNLTPEQTLKKAKLAHALMYFSRGVPVVYYGDEQGFSGDGHDQDAREDMFKSKVVSYNDNTLIGSSATTDQDNFDMLSSLYLYLKKLAEIKRAHTPLNGGSMDVLYAADKPGLYAFKRTSAESGETVVVIANSSSNDIQDTFTLDFQISNLCFKAGTKGLLKANDTSITYKAPALSWALYETGTCN